MPKKLSLIPLLLFVLVAACSSSDNDTTEELADSGSDTEQNIEMSGNSDDESVSEPSISNARYRVTFSDRWTSGNFATQFPTSRHFSGLVGASHNEQVVFWEAGQPATPGIREMAELGSKPLFEAEIETRIADGSAFEVLSGGGIGNSPGSASIEFSVSSIYPEVTLVSMVAPSPDWFVGVKNLDLRDSNGDFIDELTIALIVYDAGTDAGASFTSSDSASPGEVITQLTCEPSDCDFSDGIHRDSGLVDRTIGEFRFERL